MADFFNPDVSAAVVAAKFCRVVIYPAVRGWCGERVQLEVADTTPEQVAEEAERLRGAPVLVLRGGAANGAVDNSGGEALANP